MRRSTIIGAICLAVMIALYLIESEAKRSDTLAIIVLMVVGLVVERLFYRRAD